MNRRVILLALLLPACSILVADLPKPDIVVAADGSGDFKTIQAAVASIPANNRERVVVFIKNGTYREKIRVDASFVTLRGQSRNGTRIEFPQLKDDFTAHPDDIGWAVINLNHANDFVLENLTVENTASIMSAHAFTISGTGDRIVIVDCDVLRGYPVTRAPRTRPLLSRPVQFQRLGRFRMSARLVLHERLQFLRAHKKRFRVARGQVRPGNEIRPAQLPFRRGERVHSRPQFC